MKASSLFPSRILMTADAVGGVWTYALELARALASERVKIALAVMGPPPTPAQRAEAGRLTNLTLHEAPFALEWMDDPWVDVDRAGDWLLELAEDFRPEVVHLNGYAHAALPWAAPVVVVAHSCVFSWWSAVRPDAVPPSYKEYRRRVAEGLAAAALVVAPTAAMLAALTEHYGESAAGWVIHNAGDARRFVPGPKKPQILAAGRAWDEAKNLAGLNAVAPQVRWPIHLAGECHHPDGGGTARFDHVHCLGKLDAARMRARLAESAIYALPARYEPFGLSALEAGLSGCALVLGDIPSLREVWGDAAVFVTPGDQAALARNLNALIDDQARWNDLGQRARARALEFTPAKMTARYLEAYRFCLVEQPAEAVAA